jgi:cytochrome c biogenesis protein CcmG/thiol:disulfide interchange protein DsbE
MENTEPTLEATTDKRKFPVTAMIIALLFLGGFLAFLYFGLERTYQGPVTVGQKVKPFALQTFDGEIINTSEQENKVILVNFWASWCKPCESEAAFLQQAWQHYQPGGEVLFLGVDYVDTEPEAKASLAKFGITFPNGPDLGTRISQEFRIRGVPETYIIKKDGTLAYIQVGPFSSLKDIQGKIDPLLID